MTPIELLSPARDAATARQAILHGADAVYIGAPRFGARAAAVNSMDDIRELVTFAHVYGVKVYVTLNTILLENELDEARTMACQLYEMGVDALIVQDMAFLEMDLPPIPLHASTQMDNRNAEKVQWLRSLGFQQTVLARELSVEEIRDIHQQVPEMPLEVFVHGATCVSYNGQCYASQYCFGRSANRGECAQFCRLAFDLVDAEGRVVSVGKTGFADSPEGEVRQRHLLSLHDMNRSEELEALMLAGVTSFKVEGRLKDEAYVKNVTAYYRACIDRIIKRYPTRFCRSSVGVSSVNFAPQLDRTFNRGFSNYFANGRTRNMVQMCSPKSIGQHVGHVKEVRRNCFTVSTTVPFSNGDGICFIDANGQLQGCRINRVEGNCLYPKEMPAGLQPRMSLYRNFDQQFVQLLAHPSAHRRITVKWILSEEEGGVAVRLQSEDSVCVAQRFDIDLQPARSPQRENLGRQLSRLGDTPFVCGEVQADFSTDWFIPSSTLSEWRREMSEMLVAKRLEQYDRRQKEAQITEAKRWADQSHSAMHTSFIPQQLSFNYNVANSLAHRFYERLGAVSIEPAMELDTPTRQVPIMTLRYCPRYELGLCGKVMAPLFLRSNDGRVFPLRFDCKHCQVQVLSPAHS